MRDVGINASVQVLETAEWLDVIRTGCGRSMEEFADPSNPPEDSCLGLPPGPPSFASPHGTELHFSLEVPDPSKLLTSYMDCRGPRSHVCDLDRIQHLIDPALAAAGDDRRQQMKALMDIVHDEQFLYTYFNTEVFYGVREGLVWSPRYDRRQRVNQWDLR
jgi:hypothetical protein